MPNIHCAHGAKFARYVARFSIRAFFFVKRLEYLFSARKYDWTYLKKPVFFLKTGDAFMVLKW